MAVPPQRLDGWKAIAAYLDRDERTVQRWRHARGLPVHHLPGGKRAAVFAFTEEIDEWLAHAGENGASERPDPGAILADAEPAPAPAPSEPSSPHTPPWSRRSVAAGAVAASFLGLLIAAAFTQRVGPVASLSRVDVFDTGIVARNTDGAVAFSIPIAELVSSSNPDAVPVYGAPSVVADLNGDGSAEAVVAIDFRQRGRHAASSQLHCFSPDGTRRWVYQPARALRFGDEVFDSGPWRITDVAAVPRKDGRSDVWVSVIHNVWWPSFVVSLDPEGRETLRLVHAGHLYDLAHISSRGRDVILAAGVNNEHRAASLVVIDPGKEPVVSPQSAPEFTCRDCPGQISSRYVLFPLAEVGRAMGRPYNVGEALMIGNHDTRLSVVEANDERLRSHYTLDSELNVVSVARSDTYWEAHRRLELEGAIRHEGRCPDRVNGTSVLEWSAAGTLAGAIRATRRRPASRRRPRRWTQAALALSIDWRARPVPPQGQATPEHVKGPMTNGPKG
jgi:hypothetical protein